ncbi:MAG TPA: transposase [Steroidobacteraceae bacterium]|nr:transposase [Steroidobacteraceae bacterium]
MEGLQAGLRFILMDEITDDTKGGFRRVELLTGPGRRRTWSAAEKAQVVAETLVPGVRVSDVARRWQLHPQQLFGWRHQAKKAGKAAALREPALTRDSVPPFVPIVSENEGSPVTADVVKGRSGIEIELAGAVVRVTSGVDGELLTAVLRAVRSASGGR